MRTPEALQERDAAGFCNLFRGYESTVEAGTSGPFGAPLPVRSSLAQGPRPGQPGNHLSPELDKAAPGDEAKRSVLSYRHGQRGPCPSPASRWRISGAAIPPGRMSQYLPAYTLKGKDAIDTYMKELETALNEPLLTTAMIQEFQEYYKNSYLDAWESFGSQMPSGVQQLAGKKEWLQVIDCIATGQDPYFSFLARLKNETAPFAGNSDRAWIGLVISAGRMPSAGGWSAAKSLEKPPARPLPSLVESRYLRKRNL